MPSSGMIYVSLFLLVEGGKLQPGQETFGHNVGDYDADYYG
jgi:hypothetical protein